MKENADLALVGSCCLNGSFKPLNSNRLAFSKSVRIAAERSDAKASVDNARIRATCGTLLERDFIRILGKKA